MARNPHPSHITDATWWFMEQLLLLEPGTVNGGIWGDFKPGYHADRNTLLANPAWRNDYSIRLAADKRGPGDKGAGLDWTFRDAQVGRYFNIIKYGDRVEAAFHARDPRLKGWREVLIQADPDLYAEGFDFQGWYQRTPDSSHLWHAHFSELREHTGDFRNKRAMLSVLRGETLQQWYDREGDGMPLSTQDKADIKQLVLDALRTPAPYESPGVKAAAAAHGERGNLSLRKMTEYVLDDTRFQAAPVPVALTPEDLAAIVDALNRAIIESSAFTATIEAAAERAVRAAFERGLADDAE